MVGAVGLFLFLFVLWVLAVFQLTPASAGAGALRLRLRSNLAADYTAAPVMRMLRTLRLTVMEDVMRDMGMTDEEASAEMRAMAELLESPVPTATARGLMGEAPLTPTPTRTRVPTDTPEPTETATRRPAATPTETEEPTRKPKTKTPTPSGGPGPDEDPPEILGLDSEVSVDECSAEIEIDATIYDPPVSSGVTEVWVKYKIPGYVTSVTPLGELSFCSGGFQGDDSWEGCYAGSVTFDEIEEGWGNEGPDDFEIEIYLRPYDDEGNHDDYLIETFELSHTCDDD